jgi:hypothetical protein
MADVMFYEKFKEDSVLIWYKFRTFPTISIQLPFPDKKIEIFSDGHDDYTNTIPEYYAETCVDWSCP